MVRSMTAFARLEAADAWGRAVWELRSVNHRYLEIGLRLPEEFRHLESEVRARIAGKINRGKVDCVLRFDASAGENYKLRVNLGLAAQIAAAAREVADLMEHATPPSPMEILRWPNVLETPELDLDAVSKALLDALEATLDELVLTREREGAKLKALVLSRCDAMHLHVAELRRRVPEIVAAIRSRHEQRMKELAPTLDEVRLEQECALLAQRLDVAEEIDRLETHLGEVRRVLGKGDAVGRRLDFLMQELNREANTLGSKSAHIDTASASVELKVLTEQIREQIQNIE